MVRIQVFDDAGCTAFDSVQITAYPVPVVNIGNDTTLCGQNSLTLDAGNPGSTYLWSTGETTQQITVYPGNQTITVEVMNSAGCSEIGSIDIRPCSPKEFFANIANTFTPNNDGTNDTWLIDEVLSYPQVEIEIFDRWGDLVWSSAPGYPVPWDGRNLDGREVPMDSYFYVIHLNDGSDPINGTITVIR
jgi:gliding motility-associated-like protein